MHSLSDRISNRRFFLSYPKCGRTWFLNVFVNYLWKRDRDIIEPLGFLPNCDNDYSKKLLDEGIVFAHGFPLKMDAISMINALSTHRYEKRKTCILVRHPARIVYSYYCHIFDHVPSREKFLDFVKNDKKGIERMCSYYNYLIPEFIKRRQKFIFYYEDFHEENPLHIESFRNLFSFYFGKSLCSDSMAWAIESCYYEKLRARNLEFNPGKKKKHENIPRVREAETGLKPGEMLDSVSEELISALGLYMMDETFHFFNEKYFKK